MPTSNIKKSINNIEEFDGEFDKKGIDREVNILVIEIMNVLLLLDDSPYSYSLKCEYSNIAHTFLKKREAFKKSPKLFSMVIKNEREALEEFLVRIKVAKMKN